MNQFVVMNAATTLGLLGSIIGASSNICHTNIIMVTTIFSKTAMLIIFLIIIPFKRVLHNNS